MEVTKISSKGQITLPVSVSNRLNLNAGDKRLTYFSNGNYGGN